MFSKRFAELKFFPETLSDGFVSILTLTLTLTLTLFDLFFSARNPLFLCSCVRLFQYSCVILVIYYWFLHGKLFVVRSLFFQGFIITVCCLYLLFWYFRDLIGIVFIMDSIHFRSYSTGLFDLYIQTLFIFNSFIFCCFLSFRFIGYGCVPVFLMFWCISCPSSSHRLG